MTQDGWNAEQVQEDYKGVGALPLNRGECGFFLGNTPRIAARSSIPSNRARPHTRVTDRQVPLKGDARYQCHRGVVSCDHRSPQDGIELSLSRFMGHDASEVRRPHDGWWTVHGPAVPPARVPGYPQRTVAALQRLVPSFEAALQGHMGRCSPSRVSGCTSHAGT